MRLIRRYSASLQRLGFLGRTGAAATGLAPAIMAIFLWIATFPVHAQTVSGTVTGTVTDSSGAVIPGVQVQVKNTDTGQLRATTSTSVGIFSIPALPPGPYAVDATVQGFQETTSSITLAVGQTLNINLHMQVGSASQKVEVVANESLGLETQSHELTSEMDAKTVEEMPEYAEYVDPKYAAQLMSESMPDEDLPSTSLPRKGPGSEAVADEASSGNP